MGCARGVGALYRLGRRAVSVALIVIFAAYCTSESHFREFVSSYSLKGGIGGC